jgi:hypothetical protein
MSPRRQGTAEAAVPERVVEAVDLMEARQNGSKEPDGAWTDRVWLPSDEERRACCEGLEPDPLKDPQKLRNHCRTLGHVANLFELDGRLLRAEAKRRRQQREEAVRESRGALSRRLARPVSRSTPIAVGEGGGSAEAAVLHARLVRLVAEKRSALQALAAQMSDLLAELREQLEDEKVAVEVATAESAVGEAALYLHDLIDEITNLVITRDTIHRVL